MSSIVMTETTEKKEEQNVEDKLMEMYRYFLLDICQLVSIRETLASLEQTTRKEHYSL